MNYLSVCCIAKNEHPFIKEWINHHLLVGAERIIIFDNDSSPGLKDSIREYVDHGIVDIIKIKGKEQQMAAYDQCLRDYEKNRNGSPSSMSTSSSSRKNPKTFD